MKTCLFYKMFWNTFGYNIEISVNITRWLIGFGWFGSVIGKDAGVHINFGPIATTFYKSVD